ncbi:hypothetical protein BVC80_717g20 [Macleaya cordata]|uniref:Ricin B lectin domain n=1 Tax=Macleaya cordata TaxID=56857 RepID=A0A200PM71_MACCD|nr:hypothetical protein BVC80_717g20 [Macleaya cordata]
MGRIRTSSFSLFLAVLILVIAQVCVAETGKLRSEKLCSQCSKCDGSQCPASEAYPHMTAWDDSLIAGALQSDYVDIGDRGVYSVPNVKGGESENYNAYYGWKATAGSSSGYHWFSNYMDKCSGGQSYLSVDQHGKVALRSLSSLTSLAQADWKSIVPPPNLSHSEFRFWVSHSTGKCLTIFGGKTKKRVLGVADCKFDGSNLAQLFAFRFHYHKAFCCCGLFNN